MDILGVINYHSFYLRLMMHESEIPKMGNSCEVPELDKTSILTIQKK